MCGQVILRTSIEFEASPEKGRSPAISKAFDGGVFRIQLVRIDIPTCCSGYFWLLTSVMRAGEVPGSVFVCRNKRAQPRSPIIISILLISNHCCLICAKRPREVKRDKQIFESKNVFTRTRRIRFTWSLNTKWSFLHTRLVRKWLSPTQASVDTNLSKLTLWIYNFVVCTTKYENPIDEHIIER